MKKLIVLSLALIASACGGETQTAGSFDTARAAANDAIEAAAAKGHAWVTSDQLMLQAEQAAADGDEGRATLLAQEAREHAELALAQAVREAATWRESVISK